MFAYCLTPSPKFFSFFPYGTCPPSVSYSWWAFWEYHHSIRALVSKNTTLYIAAISFWRINVRENIPPRSYIRSSLVWSTGIQLTKLQGIIHVIVDLWIRQLLFHSPLLLKFLLAYMPILTNMLKFCRFSYLKLSKINYICNHSFVWVMLLIPTDRVGTVQKIARSKHMLST